jgi:hypothetical protein
MIISASRRTDIPAFYAEWLVNRLQAGFVLIRNPRNPNRIAKVPLTPDGVDCIVFWTKNPRPILSKLPRIDALGFSYYFQFTITPYDQHVEKGLPAKTEIIETCKTLSDRIGKHRVVWRYDPVIISHEFSVPYHLAAFDKMCAGLSGYTNCCIFSFIDLYPKMRTNAKGIVATTVSDIDKHRLVQGFAAIARHYRLPLAACAEATDFTPYGVVPAACIDPDLLTNILGNAIQAKKDPNQRPACQCVESIDLGAYDCCPHGCVYCYAATSSKTVSQNVSRHDPCSPLLLGFPRGDEILTDKEVHSLFVRQTSLF